MTNMSLDRTNSQIFKWTNPQNVHDWNSRFKLFFTKLNAEYTFNEFAVLDYMNTIFGEHFKQTYREEMP